MHVVVNITLRAPKPSRVFMHDLTIVKVPKRILILRLVIILYIVITLYSLLVAVYKAVSKDREVRCH